MNPTDLLTEEQVATMLRCSVKTVRRERERKRLGFVKLGGRVFVAPDQVEAYIRNSRIDPCPNKNDSEKSTGSGSPGTPETRPTPVKSSALGTKARPDKLADHSFSLAQQIFKRPKSSSPSGSQTTASSN
jgi:excisionase family DNA binding protein